MNATIETNNSEITELKKQAVQLEKKITDQRTSSKDQDKMIREQKVDLEKKTRENKIIQG